MEDWTIMMTIVFVVVGFLLAVYAAILAVYAVIWAYIVIGFRSQERQTIAAFLKSWEDETYTTRTEFLMNTAESCLRIEYPFDGSTKHFFIDQSGSMRSNIHWSGENRKETDATTRMRRVIEPITKQIATMARLEGKFEEYERGDDDWGATTSP